VLYFGIKSSCSSNIIQISHIQEKLKPVVIIFVHIIISAFSKFSSAFDFSILFLTTSVSKRNTLFFGYSSFKVCSICCVQIPTFCKASL
jgi:type IV secretory pathway VirB3-like protein